MNNSPSKKAKIRTGLIRWEAIVPFTIFIVLVWAYFFFFFDTHVRRGLEFAATRINGAEVNIRSLRTSFWNASLEINKIEVTNPAEPTRNSILIGQVRWRMLWDALLRGKVAIDEASILGIAIGAPRARPGYVLPPPPPDSGPGVMEALKQKALDQAQEEFSKNVLGDVAALMSGVDPSEQLKNIEGQLKSSQRLTELKTELARKQAEWQSRLASLPGQKQLQEFESRFKAVKLDRFSNPTEVQQSLQQLDSIFKDLDAQIKAIDSSQKALGNDVSTYQQALATLEAMIQSDIKDLETRMQLPKLDAGTLSRILIGQDFIGKVRTAESYVARAREYMPPKKSAAEKAAFQPPTPHERANGRNYKFGRPNSYPLFWLKKAQISSQATAGADWSGDLIGTLSDVTNDPPLIGRPLVANFKGDFPKQQVFAVDGTLTIDHVTDTPRQSLELNVGKFSLADRLFVNQPEVQIGLASAIGRTSFKAELVAEEVKITNASTFESIRDAANTEAFLFANAKQEVLGELLKGAMADIQKVELNASLSGTWSAPRFDLYCSLADDLARAFDKQIQAKIAEARAKLQNFVNEKVGKEREKLNAEFTKAKAELENLLKQKLSEFEKEKAKIDTAKREAVDKQKSKLELEGQKAIDDLKKKFGF